MDRKKFFAGLTAAALTPHIARASTTTLGPATYVGIPTRAWVANPTLVIQHCPAWCWAASISMVFGSNEHPTDQTKIVDALFGTPQCNTSGPPSNIINLINNTAWVDDNGAPFSAQVTAAYDYIDHINSLNNAMIIDELSNDRPLLYLNSHHAMLLVLMDYMNTPAGPGQVIRVGVFDPWPATAGFHPLTPVESVPASLGGQMFFVGTIQVT